METLKLAVLALLWRLPGIVHYWLWRLSGLIVCAIINKDGKITMYYLENGEYHGLFR